MSRTSPVHYIAPSAISITPNCNSSANDISVYLARGAKIGVYSPRAGIDYVDAQAQTWTLRGRNRRLADSTKPYTIYARLSKTDYTNGYLVFASKNQQGGVWYDKYNYITPLGLSDVTGATTSADYWYVRLGDVSVPSQAERTLSYDTGILGTTLFNTEWGVDPDSLPLRIDVSCTIGGEDAGVNPYVYWGGQLALTAKLVEGWIGTTLQRFTRWSIARDTGDSTADAAWQNTQKVQDFATTGTIELTHQRGAGEVDDFNGAVSTFFTITAWGAAEDGSAQDVVLVQTTVNILAETVEGFQIVCSTEFMSYNPQTHAYTPSDGVKVCLRATDQRGDVTDMTTAQIAAAQLTASYAEVGGSSWTALSFSNVGGIATATVPASAFQNGKSINVRLVNADSKELARRTIAYVKDGEDSKLREWIFLRSATEITFGTQDHPYPASIRGGEVNPTGAAGDIDTNKNQDGWVPQGWWDEQRGTTQSERYEYGAYRNYIQATSTTPAHWGDFTEPSLWSHYGQNGIDAQDVEWAYIRTKTTVPPLIDDDANYTDHNNKAYTADGHLPKVKAGSGGQLSDIEPNNSGSGSKLYECTANPKGVNDDWPYEWEIKRTKGAADATTNKRAWNAYSGSLVLRTDPAFNKYISTILGGATGNATTVANAQKAVLGALDGTTVTDNGLMLTSLIALRKLRRSDLDPTVLENYDTWGGVSGMYNADAKGYGLAAWYGGDMIDREAVQESHASDFPAWVEPAWGTGYRYAKSVDRFDGSGYRAGGNISWDASGNVTIKGTVIRDATYYVGNQDVTQQLSAILKMFELTGEGTTASPYKIHAKLALWTEYSISAGGNGGSGGGGGAGAGAMFELADVKPNSGGTAVEGAVQGNFLQFNNGKWQGMELPDFTIKVADSVNLGGIKIGYTTDATNRNYAVKLSNQQAYVNVPWVAPVQSDWNEANTASLAYIKNKPSLATVATSGSYNDLSNKPSIPSVSASVSGSKLTITINGTNYSLTDTNTWRPVEDNLSSTSTSNSLSANQGRVLNEKLQNLFDMFELTGEGTTASPYKIHAKLALWTEYSISAGGNGGSGGGGGAGAGAMFELADVKPNSGGTAVEGAVQGNFLQFNNGKWQGVELPDFTIKVADSVNLGGIKIGYTTDVTNRNYAVKLSNQQAYVNVPWVAPVQSDWNETNTASLAYIKNKPSLATVATSGSYNDLSNKPSIPSVSASVSGSKLTITINGTNYSLTDTNTWRTVQCDGSSIGNNTLNLKAGTNVSLSRSNGDITINSSYSDTWRPVQCDGSSIGNNTLNLIGGTNVSLERNGGSITIKATDTNTWRPVEDNLSSTSTSNSLSANQGRVLNNKFGSYLPLSGGTMTGTLGLRSDAYGGPSGTHGLNCNNSDIVGVNSIYTNDTSDGWDEGIEFKRSNGNWDSLYALDGSFYFKSNNGGGYANLYVNTLYASTQVKAASDARFKEVVKNTEITVEQIAQMPSVIYRWKDREDKSLYAGTLAQSWEGVLPEVVSIADDKEHTRSFSYGVAALVSAIQDAREIVALKKEIRELKAEIKLLKKGA